MFKRFNMPAGIITLLIGIWCVTPGLIAQDKIGYIDSPKVLSVYPAAIDANKQLETENNKWSLELQKLQEKFRAITEQLDKQSLLLSDAKKKEKEQERQAVYEEIQKYQDKKWGDRGDYFTLQRDLVKPIFDEINAVLTRIGEEEDFAQALKSLKTEDELDVPSFLRRPLFSHRRQAITASTKLVQPPLYARTQ